MFPAVKEILETNKRERHIRGGLATKHKYEELKEIREKRNKACDASGGSTHSGRICE